MTDLRQMRYLMRKIPEMAFAVEKAYSKAMKMTTQYNDMPHGKGGVHSNTEDGAIAAAELKEAYKAVTDELEKMRKELEPKINDLENPDERAVMRMRYLNGYSTSDIADAIHRCERQVKRYLYPAEDKIMSMEKR